MKKFLLPLLAFVGACSGEIQTSPSEVDTGPPKPKPTVTITAPSNPLPFNTMVQIGWSSTDASVCSAPWISTSSPSGQTSLRVTKPSWFALTCTGPGGSIEDSVRIEVLPRTLHLLVYIPLQNGDGYSLDTAFSTFSIQNGSKIDSLSVKGTGALPFSNVSPDTIAFTLSGNTSFPKVLASVPKATFDTWGDTISIVRIPRAWTVEKGLYAGVKIASNLMLPYANSPDGTSFYPRARVAANSYSYRELGWNNNSFPIKIWIDSLKSVSPDSIGSSGIVPTSEDSVRLANGLSILDQFVGWNPFFLKKFSLGDVGISAYISISKLPNGGASSNGNFEKFIGTYGTPATSRFGSPEEVEHELFHVFGFGHNCAWPGIMQSRCVWDKPNTITSPELEKDVAFFELWQSVNDIRRKTGARIHWGENLAGTQDEAKLPLDRVVYPL